MGDRRAHEYGTSRKGLGLKNTGVESTAPSSDESRPHTKHQVLVNLPKRGVLEIPLLLLYVKKHGIYAPRLYVLLLSE